MENMSSVMSVDFSTPSFQKLIDGHEARVAQMNQEQLARKQRIAADHQELMERIKMRNDDVDALLKAAINEHLTPSHIINLAAYILGTCDDNQVDAQDLSWEQLRDIAEADAKATLGVKMVETIEAINFMCDKQ